MQEQAAREESTRNVPASGSVAPDSFPVPSGCLAETKKDFTRNGASDSYAAETAAAPSKDDSNYSAGSEIAKKADVQEVDPIKTFAMVRAIGRAGLHFCITLAFISNLN